MMMPLIALFTACSTHQNQLHVAGEKLPALKELVVAEPVFWGETLKGDPFRQNSTVGNITFEGGYISKNDGSGIHNVSKIVTISQEEIYRGHITQWLEEALHPTVVVDSPPPPQARETRGTTSKDGHDNISLPRVSYQPVAIEPLPHPTLIPWVINYYTHNAGWFYGQQWGTLAGARIHLVLVAYDRDGSVLGWSDIDSARISENLSSPSEPELQDLLLALEKKIGKRLPH